MARPSFPVFSGGGQLLPRQDSENTIVHPIAPYRPVSEGLAIAPTVSVVIPARNEAANLPHVFGTLPPWVNEIILVDGHSVDDTVAVARRLCPAVKVVRQSGRGKGDALYAGFAAATGDILVMIDADGSTDGAEMIRFVGALLAGADFAKGSRFSSSGGSDDITGIRRYGNRVLSFMVNSMFGTHFTDLCYGYNAFWARHLDAIEISQCPGFEVETLMNIRAAKAGLTIYEVPSHECPRIFGASNLHAVRDGWRILKIILRERVSGRTRRDQPQQAAPPPAGSPVLLAPHATGPFRLPGPDHEPSVRDRDIVAAIAEGDDLGIAAAFGRYAQGLYAYCRSQLAEPAAAASAVQDTFVLASAGVRALKRPDRLRAWLFALARNECQRRLQAAGPSARLYEGAHAMQDTGTFGLITPGGETRALVRAAIAGLDPVDGEIGELHLRHGFYGTDLADILGLSRGQAHTLAARARSRFEKSMGVLLLARSQREHCPELSALLDEESSSLRWRVKRHIGRCEVCGVRKRNGLNPAILLGLLPAAAPPADLRRQTLRLVGDRSPVSMARRAEVKDRAAPSRADGFPVQITPLTAPGLRAVAVIAIVVAAAALALLGAAMYYAGHPSGAHAAAAAAAGRSLPLAKSARSGDPARGSAGAPSAAASPAAPGSGLTGGPGPGASVPIPVLGIAGAKAIGPSSIEPSRASSSPAKTPSPSRPAPSSSAPRSSPAPSQAPPSSAPPSSPAPSSPAPSSLPPSSPDPPSSVPPSVPPTDALPSASSPSATGGTPG